MESRAEGGEFQCVASLANFPFPDFHEFRKACTVGTAQPFMSRSTACQWARLGVHSSKWLNLQVWVLGSTPHMTLLVFLIYAVLRKPLLLLGTPLLVIGYFLFNPTMIAMLRIFAWGPLILVSCTFIWAFAKGSAGLIVFTGALLVIWYSQRLMQNKALRALGKALTEHEDLLCQLWTGRAVGIAYPDGRICWADHESSGGQNKQAVD